MTNVVILPIEVAGLETRWSELSSRAPQHSVFSSFHYAQALSESFGITCEAAFAQTESKEDAAGVLLFSRKKGPFKQVIVPPFTPYTSILTASSDPYQAGEDTPLSNLMASLSGRYDDLRLHLHPSITDLRPFQWMDWTPAPLYTYAIDVNIMSDDFGVWSAGTRRTFRKHLSEYLFQESPEAAADVIALCAGSYRRQNRSFPIVPERLEALVGRLQQKNMVRVFTVRPTNRDDITGGLIVLHDDKEAFYWIAGSIPGPSMTVLIGRLLLELKSSSFHRFDFVGANTPTIAEFKRRFGPILTPYWAVTHCPNRVLRSFKDFRGFF